MITIVLTRIFLISYVVKRSKKIWEMLLKNEKKKKKKEEDEIPLRMKILGKNICSTKEWGKTSLEQSVDNVAG